MSLGFIAPMMSAWNRENENTTSFPDSWYIYQEDFYGVKYFYNGETFISGIVGKKYEDFNQIQQIKQIEQNKLNKHINKHRKEIELYQNKEISDFLLNRKVILKKSK